MSLTNENRQIGRKNEETEKERQTETDRDRDNRQGKNMPYIGVVEKTVYWKEGRGSSPW